MKSPILYNIICLLLLSLIVGCSDDKYAIPEVKTGLQNDVIKRTLGPNMVGLNIDFAYAMALQANEGHLTSAQVEASIPGADGTWLDHHSYYTNGSGDDVGIVVGEPSVTEGNKTAVKFTTDTNASTLRYYYAIPEEARGNTVSFKFSAKSNNGQEVSYDMGPYQISKMDMVLDLQVIDGDRCFISITDMAVYNAEEAVAKADKIDLVYLYRSLPNITFNHALVAPAADEKYRPSVLLPPGVNRNVKIQKTWNLRDRHLARLQYGVYIDDSDFQEIDLSAAPNFAINLKQEAGAWVETADGKYKAYIYINAVNNSEHAATISIKRYINQ